MTMKKVDYIWMNGKFVKWNDAKIHILTYTLHYGGGVFEGIRCYNTPKGPAIFRLIDHMKRMERSAKLLGMKIPYSTKQFCNITKKLIIKNKLKECYIRPIVYYGYGKMGLDPRGAPVDVAIAVWPWGKYLGEESIERGVKCKISKWRRIDKRTVPTSAKCCGYYVNSMIAHNEAVDAGCDEAILLNTSGNAAEGPGENLFIVKQEILITPPLSAGILPGITRDSIIKLAKEFKIRVKERDITKQQLLSADECFFSGTAAEITPIRMIDGKKIGNEKRGPITEILQNKFYDIIHGKDKKYNKWLDFVR